MSESVSVDVAVDAAEARSISSATAWVKQQVGSALRDYDLEAWWNSVKDNFGRDFSVMLVERNALGAEEIVIPVMDDGSTVTGNTVSGRTLAKVTIRIHYKERGGTGGRRQW